MDPSVEAPRGHFEARVDPKGRLRLPMAFRDFLGHRAQLFATTFDLKTIRLYPVAEWARLRREGEPAAFERAERLGNDGEISNEGRLLIGHELRSATGLAETVWLHWAKDHVELRGTQGLAGASAVTDESDTTWPSRSNRSRNAV